MSTPRGSGGPRWAPSQVSQCLLALSSLLGTGQPTLLQHINAKDAAIGQIDQEVDAYVEPFRTAIEIEILGSIPGISDLSAQD